MPYRVRVAPWPPYSFPKVDGRSTRVSGIAGDVYDAMKLRMPFEYEGMLQPDKGFGTKNASGSWSGMVGAMVRNETDISGPYTINEPRSLAVEFTIPVGFSQLSIVSGMVSTNRDPSLIFRIFSTKVWLLIPVSVIIVACAATAIYATLPSPEKKRTWKALSKYLWTFQFSLLGVGFGGNNRWFLRHVWSSLSFRILQAVWLLTAGLVLHYTYQGGIISAFSSDNLKPKVETLEDLKDDESIGVSVFKNNYPYFALKTLENTTYDSIWQRATQSLRVIHAKGVIPPWTDEIEQGKLVFVSESMLMKDLFGRRFLKTGKCGVRTTLIDLLPAYIAFGFRKEYKGTKDLRKFNEGLRLFNEAGLAHLRYASASMFYDLCTGTNSPVRDPLNLSDLLGAFLLLGAGIGLSTIILCFELCIHRQMKKTV